MKPLFASALSLTTYNSAVEELASLYKDTKDKKLSKVLPLGVTEDKAKDFLNEFLVFCKKVGAVFNTMESSKLWKVISTIMTLHSIFSLIFDKSNPVCNINSNAVDSEYQVECEENYDDSFHCEHDDFNYKINIKEIEIDLGKRT